MTSPLRPLRRPALTNSGNVVKGRVEPRLWTPPLRELTPDTSFGYDLIDFAETIGWPLDPWQRWLAIHIGELLPDGCPRFRIVLTMVARQNGKSVFCRLLTLYWMFVETVPYIFGINSTRDTAKKSWKEAIKMAESIEMLAEELPPRHVNKQIGEEAFWNNHGSTYLFGAPNSRAGRSLTIDRAVIDELRQHKNRDAWDALIPTMNAVPDAQAVIITNEGDESAIVLHELLDLATEFIETGQGDSRLGLFAWTSPRGADPTDVEALAYANPDLGNRIQLDALLGQAMQAKRAGGETLARFRIEIMCQRVALLDSAIDEYAWNDSGTDTPIDLAQHRDKLALCLDVSIDASHATLMAAATVDAITHVEVIERWHGYGCTKLVRAELPALVQKLKPRAFGWFPGGPAASVAASLRKPNGDRKWYPIGTQVEELKGETTAVCMGLAEQVLAGEIQHPKDDMLTAHVSQTQKLWRGDAWVYTRKQDKPIDATYALAGAVHLARTLKPKTALVAM